MEFVSSVPLLWIGVRILLPLLAGAILFLCGKSLFGERRTPEIWAWLTAPNGAQLPVHHWENTIGRGKNCDVSVQYPTISRMHAVLLRSDRGEWTVSDVGSKGGVTVDGKAVDSAPVSYGQIIGLAGVEFVLVPISREQEKAQAAYRAGAARPRKPVLPLLLLTGFQLLLCLSLMGAVETPAVLFCAMGALCVAQWALLGFYGLIRRNAYEAETLAFFLCSLCLAVTASALPENLTRQTLCILAGVAVYLVLGWSVRDLRRAKTVRYLAGGLGILLLIVNLIFGREVGGARNWVFFAGISVQPSELVKLCFVLVGTSTLERLVTKRNFTLFLVYTLVLCAGLALLSDFGTALVFFVAFLVIAFLRSGDLAALSLIGGGTAFAGLLAVRFLPYIRKRFSVWGRAWEDPLAAGYQQTRAMMCIAAGGLFGVGAGRGWLKYVAASDTDLIFAFLGEEYGLVLAILSVMAVLLLALYAVRSASGSRSSFYAIAACAAASILLTQTILNVLGTLDLLPLTGVTFPFLSRGGSSAISAWGLLSFIKSADARQNASFTVRLPEKEREKP